MRTFKPWPAAGHIDKVFSKSISNEKGETRLTDVEH